MHAWRGQPAAGVAAALLALAVTARSGAQSCPGPIPEPSALDLRPAAPPLLVSRTSALALRLAWEDTAVRYVPSRGTLAALWSRRHDHASLDCDLAVPSLDVPDDAGDVYFVVAARSDTELGSSGRDSFARERPGPTPACPPFVGCGEGSAAGLPDVCVEFPSAESTFTLAEAAAGVTIPYDVIVEVDIPDVTPLEHSCECCGGDTSCACGLILFEMLSGSGQVYCICDDGIECDCVPVALTVRQGRFSHAFTWDGRNAQTPGPGGAPFPPGTYTLEVSTVGYRDSPSGTVPFRVAATHRVTLVP
jgi:hypothetical protein